MVNYYHQMLITLEARVLKAQQILEKCESEVVTFKKAHHVQRQDALTRLESTVQAENQKRWPGYWAAWVRGIAYEVQLMEYKELANNALSEYYTLEEIADIVNWHFRTGVYAWHAVSAWAGSEHETDTDSDRNSDTDSDRDSDRDSDTDSDIEHGTQNNAYSTTDISDNVLIPLMGKSDVVSQVV